MESTAPAQAQKSNTIHYKVKAEEPVFVSDRAIAEVIKEAEMCANYHVPE